MLAPERCGVAFPADATEHAPAQRDEYRDRPASDPRGHTRDDDALHLALPQVDNVNLGDDG